MLFSKVLSNATWHCYLARCSKYSAKSQKKMWLVLSQLQIKISGVHLAKNIQMKEPQLDPPDGTTFDLCNVLVSFMFYGWIFLSIMFVSFWLQDFQSRCVCFVLCLRCVWEKKTNIPTDKFNTIVSADTGHHVAFHTHFSFHLVFFHVHISEHFSLHFTTADPV